MTRGRTSSADGWITVGVKMRESDVKRLDTARGTTFRSEWIRLLVLASLEASWAEVIAPGAFEGALPAEVPLTASPGGPRIGTAQVSQDDRGLSFSAKTDCPHPKARRSKGGLCMACGQNIGA